MFRKSYRALNSLNFYQKRDHSVDVTAVKSSIYCRDLVRKHDWEGYICSLLFPKICLKDVIAIRAFNVEVAQVSSNTRQDANARIRYAFWKEILEDIYEDNVPALPVATELYNAVKKFKLSKLWFSRMINAREQFKNFDTIGDVEEYADHTTTAQLCLMLQCLGISNIHADHIASHIGKAQTITTLLRSTKFYTRNNQVLLPQELLIKYNVSQEAILRQKCNENVRNLAFDFACQAQAHLQHSRTIKINEKNSHKAFLIATSLEWYLKLLEKNNFDIFHPSLHQRNDILPISVFKNNLFKKF